MKGGGGVSSSPGLGFSFRKFVVSTLDLPRRCMEDEASVSNNKACLGDAVETPRGTPQT